MKGYSKVYKGKETEKLKDKVSERFSDYLFSRWRPPSFLQFVTLIGDTSGFVPSLPHIGILGYSY